MKRFIHSYALFLAVALMLLSSCARHPDVPSSSKEAKCLPAIFPDYCDVTVPYNIAPLNFMLPADDFDECVARFTTPDGRQQTYGNGVKVQIPRVRMARDAQCFEGQEHESRGLGTERRRMAVVQPV